MEVISRLFDHKLAVQGELAYFVNEFESTLNKDDQAVYEIDQHVKALSEVILPSCLSMTDENLPCLQSKVDACCKLSQRILELDQANINDQMHLKEDLYFEFEEDEFLKKIARQKEDVEAKFQESLAKLHEEYEKMETQLRRENPPAN